MRYFISFYLPDDLWRLRWILLFCYFLLFLFCCLCVCFLLILCLLLCGFYFRISMYILGVFCGFFCVKFSRDRVVDRQGVIETKSANSRVAIVTLLRALVEMWLNPVLWLLDALSKASTVIDANVETQSELLWNLEGRPGADDSD